MLDKNKLILFKQGEDEKCCRDKTVVLEFWKYS